MAYLNKGGGKSLKFSKPKKILVIGSGPIVIGQAAEFDYSGTQACQALKEEGYHVILANSNPATIMTDSVIADEVYMEPLNVEYIKKIINKEKPDALLPTLGGQTALNIAYELDKEGFLQETDVTLLGVSAESIKRGEDRFLFKQLMLEINEPVPDSKTVHSITEARNVAEIFGFPLIVRPAYTLGGTGGGLCNNLSELEEIAANGLSLSPINQCLIERSIAGFKEIEMEVMRDKYGQSVIVCNMENLDPVGIHTGDSIVVSPCQTLTDKEYQMLRNSALKIIDHLNIIGGCNIQFALNPLNNQYYIIEVNPRVSRSSALASKATGYPIAKIAAMLAVGKGLHEIKNPITENTFACYEPVLDYVVVKIPVFPSEKFGIKPDLLGTQMKATGEIMAIGRTFEEAFLKGVRSVSKKYEDYWLGIGDFSLKDIFNRLKYPDNLRVFLIGEAIRRGITTEKIYEVTKINEYYLNKIKKIIDLEISLKKGQLTKEYLLKAKKIGLSDYQIAKIGNLDEDKILSMRLLHNIKPVYKMVDTCAGEFESYTPYYYSTYEQYNDSSPSKRKKIIIIGSGSIQVGQGIEFDYATVHSIKSVKDCGYESIIINNNPETVSTDFSISNKLYFEPLTLEDIMNIIELEKPIGVIVQFGGQLAINLAKRLNERGVNVLGTSVESIECGENRGKLANLLYELDILHPKGYTVFNLNEAYEAVNKIGYPVIVRPSYVIGGSDMIIIENIDEFKGYIHQYNFTIGNPLHIDEYVKGIELELDAVCDGKNVIVPGILEHIECSGVHSGDSISIYPPKNLGENVQKEILAITEKISRKLEIRGLVNIQAVYSNQRLYIIEINLRSSRTLPFISKIRGVNMADLATKCQLGYALDSLVYEGDSINDTNNYLKVPVFSFSKMTSIDPMLGPEMKSTGEVIGYDSDFDTAILKAFLASGANLNFNKNKFALLLIDDMNHKVQEIVEMLSLKNIPVILSKSIYDYFKTIEKTNKKIITSDYNEATDVVQLMDNKEISLVINTRMSKLDAEIRKKAVNCDIPLFTNLDTFKMFMNAVITLDAIESEQISVSSFYKDEHIISI